MEGQIALTGAPNSLETVRYKGEGKKSTFQPELSRLMGL